MTTTRPDINPEGLYELKDAAAALAISRSTLHRMTERGDIKARVRRVNGHRIWKGSDLIRLWLYIE